MWGFILPLVPGFDSMTAVPQFQHRTSAKKRAEDDLTQHQPRSQPQTQSFILSRLSRHLITLTVLPRVKGAFIGLMYALAVKDADARLHTADLAD